MSIKLLLLGTEGTSADILFHALGPHCQSIIVVLEERKSPVKLVQNRLKKLSVSRVLGQLLFQLLVMPVMSRMSAKRRQEIARLYELESNPIPDSAILRVPSANSAQCADLINEYQPDVVLLSGTRILSQKTIEGIRCPIINIHAGITPQYRGVHGAYWALRAKDPERCGVTLHFVDAGIDTGHIIAQSRIHPTSKDNFTTYPILQIATGIKLLQAHLDSISSGTLSGTSSSEKGQLWYHPTIWEYLWHWWKHSIN